MNLRVFPAGYLNAYTDREEGVKSLSIVNEMKRGILNGPATILVNEKKICKTSFSDQIEFMRSKNHPIGPGNMITNDRAAINFVLVLLVLTCLFLAALSPENKTLWIVLSIVVYALQWLEVFFCQTTQLLQAKEAWDDLELFKKWFYELKRCRPVLTFSFSPT